MNTRPRVYRATLILHILTDGDDMTETTMQAVEKFLESRNVKLATSHFMRGWPFMAAAEQRMLMGLDGDTEL